VVENLRGAFGLDDFDVSTSAQGGTALRFGKYLSENIYTDFVIDSEGKTEIDLNLDVTPSITARGSLGDSGETDLGVFFERDY
jgi:translocation and assembly module TamB